MKRFERFTVKIDDSQDLVNELADNQTYYFAGSILWGDNYYLVFEREVSE